MSDSDKKAEKIVGNLENIAARVNRGTEPDPEVPEVPNPHELGLREAIRHCTLRGAATGNVLNKPDLLVAGETNISNRDRMNLLLANQEVILRTLGFIADECLAASGAEREIKFKFIKPKKEPPDEHRKNGDG